MNYFVPLSLLFIGSLGFPAWGQDPQRPTSKPKTHSLRDQDFAAELPRIPPKEPAAALQSFRLHSGFRIELVASEPLIRSPVAMDFDEDGRLYVVEYPEYNQYANKNFHG